MTHLDKTDKTTLAGLYIAKFDQAALSALGFGRMRQAFNVLGYSLGSSPASIKNYRDEFDRLFPENPRQGWQRTLKTRSAKLYSLYGSLDFESFTELVKGFLIPGYEYEKTANSATDCETVNESVARRLMTGKAAEAYFVKTYREVPEFDGYDCMDTTNFACGFDFKLSLASNCYCVEVKGLSLFAGRITLTEKEYNVAATLRAKYCLFVVKNFSEHPCHQLYFDPLSSDLTFQQKERLVKQIDYTAQV
ncbi:MAG: DUF3883 domain-containing protein [Clostridiales Family XIII bacterium]|jgi:hypothetical protein|nr:DUF3883 domain-containing protein [Clostridiales Family XIII bacterium]